MNIQTEINPQPSPGRSFWKFITYLFFPGFVTLATAFYLSSELITAMNQAPLAQPYFSNPQNHNTSTFLLYGIPTFGFLILPMLVSFWLTYTKRISNIEMPQANQRILPLISSIFGAWIVFAYFGTELKLFRKFFYTPSREVQELLAQYADSPGRILPTVIHPSLSAIHIQLSECTAFAILITLSLALVTLCNYLNFKISIHSSAIASATLFLSLHALRIQSINANQAQPNTSSFFILGSLITTLVYVSRRKLQAHTHTELISGILFAAIINLPTHIIVQGLISK
jgi:hypothetical protein